MIPSLAFVGGLVVDSRRSKFHVADPTLVVVSRARRLVGAVNKPSGHCCTHSGTTAGMLAEPIRSLRALCDETTTNNSNS